MKNEEDQHGETTQLNYALEQRNAGRDYHEYFVPGSIKLLLATCSQEELNRMALDNSRLFRYRFGFEPPKKVVRQQVLDIQKQYELTDEEVRWMRHAGQLQISRNEAKLVPSRLMPATGWLQLAMLSLVCIALVFQIAFSAAPAWKQGLGQLVVSILWFGGAWGLNSLFLAPWQTLKRSGAIPGTKMSR